MSHREYDGRAGPKDCAAPLDGLPIAVKDLCDIEGQATACGSLAWADRRSAATALVVERLRRAGMVILGKAPMVELLMLDSSTKTISRPSRWLFLCAFQVLRFHIRTAASSRSIASFSGFCGLKPSELKMRQTCVWPKRTSCMRPMTAPTRLSIHRSVRNPCSVGLCSRSAARTAASCC